MMELRGYKRNTRIKTICCLEPGGMELWEESFGGFEGGRR
jgi:hypothetical protein